jgi:hypothetical protein
MQSKFVVDFVNCVAWVFEVLPDVFTFGRGIVKVVEIVDDCEARDVI